MRDGGDPWRWPADKPGNQRVPCTSELRVALIPLREKDVILVHITPSFKLQLTCWHIVAQHLLATERRHCMVYQHVFLVTVIRAC